MAKKEKGFKQAAFYKSLKPFIQNRNVQYALLGAVAAGAVLGFVMGPEKAQGLVQNFTDTIKNLGQRKKSKKKKHKKLKLGKRNKPPKPFALEDL